MSGEFPACFSRPLGRQLWLLSPATSAGFAGSAESLLQRCQATSSAGTSVKHRSYRTTAAREEEEEEEDSWIKSERPLGEKGWAALRWEVEP